MTAITTTHYTHPTTGATATVVIYRSLGVLVVKAYVGEGATPRWEERVRLQGSRDIAEQSARCWTKIYALRLENDYHMQRAA